MIKIAQEQAVMAEVAGATGSLLDSGVIKLASEEDLDLLIKVATELSLAEGYSTPYELVDNILAADEYLSKNASELDYEDVEPKEDPEDGDYDEDAEDAEEDAIAEVLKQASDEAVMDKLAELYETGYISKNALEKVAKNLPEAIQGQEPKTHKIPEMKKAFMKYKQKVKSKLGRVAPYMKLPAAAAAGAGAGVGAYAAYNRKKQSN